jgi:hypothetical protein
MARNVRQQEPASGEELTREEVAASLAATEPKVPEGGAPGHISETLSPPVLRIPGMHPHPSSAKPEPAAAPKAKRYVVRGGPETITYYGARFKLVVGKVYADNHVSIALLKGQGVLLEELPEG